MRYTEGDLSILKDMLHKEGYINSCGVLYEALKVKSHVYDWIVFKTPYDELPLLIGDDITNLSRVLLSWRLQIGK